MAEKLKAIRSLGRWTAPLLTAGALLLLGLVALLEYETLRGFRELDRETDVQRQLLGDIADVRNLARAMVDMESGLHGFVIAGNEAFLDSYQAGNGQLERTAARLGQRWRDEPGQAEILADIARVAHDWRESFAAPILDRRRGARTQADFAQIDAEIARGEGKRRVDSVRKSVDFLEERLSAQLSATANLIDTRSEAARQFALRAGAAILLAVAFMAAVLSRGFRTAAERNRELERQIRERQSAERRAQASEARFLSFLNGVGEAVVITDAGGHIAWANPAFEHLFGRSAHMLEGSSIERLAGGDDASRLPALLERLAAGGERESFEVTGRRADGSEFPAEVAISRFETPAGPQLAIVVRDIRERKEIERLKSVFIASVSHELRTPLTSIMGSLALLREGEAGEIPVAAKSFVAMAHDNCTRLARLVDDVIDIERIGSGALDFRIARHGVPAFMREAVVLNQGYARAHEVFFFLDEPLPAVAVDVDRDRLLQAVTNLLSNAAKFSPAGEEVHVAARLAGERVRLEVTDRGPGIPEAFRGRIFEKFAQADESDAREKGGTGLGLAIARAIVERLGGTIGFDTAIGEGTTFWIELPVVARLGDAGGGARGKA